MGEGTPSTPLVANVILHALVGASSTEVSGLPHFATFERQIFKTHMFVHVYFGEKHCASGFFQIFSCFLDSGYADSTVF